MIFIRACITWYLFQLNNRLKSIIIGENVIQKITLLFQWVRLYESCIREFMYNYVWRYIYACASVFFSILYICALIFYCNMNHACIYHIYYKYMCICTYIYICICTHICIYHGIIFLFIYFSYFIITMSLSIHYNYINVIISIAVMAYMEMFGNCSHSNNDFISGLGTRHSVAAYNSMLGEWQNDMALTTTQSCSFMAHTMTTLHDSSKYVI